MRLPIDLNSVEDYRLFLRVKALPKFRVIGRFLEFPDEYAGIILGKKKRTSKKGEYVPWPGMFDYQGGIAGISIAKKKFCTFAEPGRGKTFIMADIARHVQALNSRKTGLFVSPLMVIEQTIDEINKFYRGSLKVEQIAAKDIQSWLLKGEGLGITNFEAMRGDLDRGRLQLLSIDESSIMKDAYSTTGQAIVSLGEGLPWKFCFTGTPAPNDRIEYATHSVFMDAYPTVNAFLSRFFINRGSTSDRWELKPHAVEPFYRALSHWSIFLVNPSTYGWKDQTQPLPAINVHIHYLDLTNDQRKAMMAHTGALFVDGAGGIASRSKLGQIGKGMVNGQKIEALKPQFVCDIARSWPDKSTLIWCLYNAEQDQLAAMMPEAASIDGDTPYAKRAELIRAFKEGRIKTLISKPRVLGYGLNLQIATKQIFSGLSDSYERYFQAIKRSNRIGSHEDLDVHIPVSEVEIPQVENVLRKAKNVATDSEEQERLFRKLMVRT